MNCKEITSEIRRKAHRNWYTTNTKANRKNDLFEIKR